MKIIFSEDLVFLLVASPDFRSLTPNTECQGFTTSAGLRDLRLLIGNGRFQQSRQKSQNEHPFLVLRVWRATIIMVCGRQSTVLLPLHEATSVPASAPHRHITTAIEQMFLAIAGSRIVHFTLRFWGKYRSVSNLKDGFLLCCCNCNQQPDISSRPRRCPSSGIHSQSPCHSTSLHQPFTKISTGRRH